MLPAWRWLGLFALPINGAGFLRQPAPPEAYIKNDLPLDDLAHDAQVSSINALAAASDARSVAAESGGRGSAENAMSMEFSAGMLAGRTEQQQPFLDGTLREASKQKNAALVAVRASKNGYNSAVIMQQEAIKNAVAWSTRQTESEIADPIRKLQEWKMAVLHDPEMEAHKAAQAAAAPYEKSLNQIHQRIMEYQQRAEDLQSQGYGLQQDAQTDAKKAVGKQKGEKLKAAADLMIAAHHEMVQGTMFIANAKKLWKKADDLYADWQDYHGAAMKAAASAMHRFAPHLFAPPPSSASKSAIPGSGPPSNPNPGDGYAPFNQGPEPELTDANAV